MSAFLGPIHFWMYNKIQVQQQIVEDLIEFSQGNIPGLQEELDNLYGESETRPLEEVIDEGNIHGWLQSKVTQVEYKLAYTVTKLLKNNEDDFARIQEIFVENGKKIAAAVKLSSATQAFKLMNDSLLDGMPCDHVNSLVKESDDETVWKKNSCVHSSYWEQVGGNVEIYYQLRDGYITGLLYGSSFVYEKIDQNTNRIVKA